MSKNRRKCLITLLDLPEGLDELHDVILQDELHHRNQWTRCVQIKGASIRFNQNCWKFEKSKTCNLTLPEVSYYKTNFATAISELNAFKSRVFQIDLTKIRETSKNQQTCNWTPPRGHITKQTSPPQSVNQMRSIDGCFMCVGWIYRKRVIWPPGVKIMKCDPTQKIPRRKLHQWPEFEKNLTWLFLETGKSSF